MRGPGARDVTMGPTVALEESPMKRVVVALLVLIAIVIGVIVWMGTQEPQTRVVRAQTVVVKVGTVTSHEARARQRQGGPASRWVRRGPGSVVGTIREYSTSKPLPGVEVTLEAGKPGPDETLHAVSQADGSFSFREVTNFESWTLRAKAPAPYADAELAGVEVVQGQETNVGPVYLAPGFVVPGVVVDDRGDPVAGATVRAVRERPPASRNDLLRLIRELPTQVASVDSATTGQDGSFRLTRVPPGTYDFLVRAPAYSMGVEEGVIIRPEAAEHPLRFVIARGFRLDGRVVRQPEGPAAGLSVVAFRQPADLAGFLALDREFATTDEKGEFHFDGLGGGRYVVAVTPEGEPFAIADDVDIPAKKFVEIVLQGDASLEGAVTGPDKKPIQGAAVYAAAFRGGPVVGHAQTGPDGRYAIRGMKSGPLTLFLVQAEGYGMWPDDLMQMMRGRGGSVVLQPGRNVKDVSLEFGATIKGVVLEKGTQTPVSGARVAILSAAAFFGGSRGATTGEDGLFEITSVPKGTCVLVVSKDGWFQPGVNPQTMMMVLAAEMQGRSQQRTDPGQGATVVVSEAGEVIDRTLELAQGAMVAGQVVDPNGVPVGGAQVSIGLEAAGPGPMQEFARFFPLGEPQLTDAEGKFRLPGPPPAQKAHVTARAQGWLEGTSEPFTVSPGDALDDVTVKLRTGAVIEGKITDTQGKALAGALVRWVTQTDQDWGTQWRLRTATPTVTDEDGTFRIQQVEPGMLIVQASHDDHVSKSTGGVEAEEGKAARVDMALEPGRVLAGTVVGPDGKKVAGARVDVERVGGQDAGADPFADSSPDVTTDGSGAFALRGLSPGKYALRARAEGAAPSERVEAEAGGPAVVQRHPHAVSISGTVRVRGGAPVGGVRVNAMAPQEAGTPGTGRNQVGSAETAASGDFEIRGLPAGIYDLSVQQGWNWGGGERPNVIPTVVKEVQAGRQRLLIELEPGLVISGTVKLADGQPATEGWAWCRLDVQSPGADEAFNASGMVAEGRFEISGLKPGRYHVTVGIGATQRTLTAEAGQRDLRVEFGAGGAIHGRVTVDGRMAEGASVWAHGAGGNSRVQADERGEYEIEGLADGTYTVGAGWGNEGVQYHAEARDIVVRSGAVVEVDLSLQKQE